MNNEEYTYKQANDIGLEFSLKMKKLAKILKKENDHFAKKGVVGFNDNRESYEQQLIELQALYKEMNKKQVIEQIDKLSLEKIHKEHDAFTKLIEQYEINVMASVKVGQMFFDITKDNVSGNTRENMGYNQEAGLATDKKILDNMPPVAVDNKV